MLYEELQQDAQVAELLKKGNRDLGVLGFTDHSVAHTTLVAERAAYILRKLGYSEREQELAKIAGIEIQEHAEKMFRAGSSLADKTPEEIFYQDFKKFSGNDKNFGAGQISSMDKTELEQLRPKIAAYMEGAVKEGEMLFFLLTNILTESSDLVFAGEGAKELVETAFGEPQENWVHVPGLVSRKKQFVPSVLHVLQQ